MIRHLREELVPAEQLQEMLADRIRLGELHRNCRGPIELGEPKSPEEAANTEGLRQLGHGIMPPASAEALDVRGRRRADELEPAFHGRRQIDLPSLDGSRGRSPPCRRWPAACVAVVFVEICKCSGAERLRLAD